MSILLINSSPPVYADRIKTRHVTISAVCFANRYADDMLLRSFPLATVLNIDRGLLTDAIADQLGQLHLPPNIKTIWVENTY